MGNRIKELREAQRLSQKELAALINCTPSALQKIEANRTGLNQQWMNLLAEALDCYPSDLLPSDQVRPAEIRERLIVEVVTDGLTWIDENRKWLDEQGYDLSPRKLGQSVAHIYTALAAADAPADAATVRAESDNILRFAAKSA